MTPPASSFDVVLVGTDLAPLIAGALLSKRGFRVLLVTQDSLPPTYEATEGLHLPRAPFTLLPSDSPVVRKVFSELALHQQLRRLSRQADPVLQVCLPGHRIEIPSGDDRLDRELEREFPEIKRSAEDLLRSVHTHGAIFDTLLDRDLAWPPQTFFEKREHARAAAQQPFGRDGDGHDPLRELPDLHPFRHVISLPARFADGMDPDSMTGLRLSRHFHSWRRGITLEGNEKTLRELLVASIRTHGGEVRSPERIDAVRVRRGTAVGVKIAASGEELGADWVLYGSSLGNLLRLVPDRDPFERVFERIGEPVVRHYRYTLNLVLDGPGVPPGMARDVFFLRDPDRPASAENALRIQLGEPDAESRRVVTVEALIPRRSVEDIPDYLTTMRERIVASLGALMPFIGSHVELMDSPHDGRGIQDFREKLDRTPAAPWTRGPQTMRKVYGFPVTRALGLCALPVRSPFKRLLFCSEQVAPGLGMEGSFLTAWNAARMVERSDRTKERMRRGRWGKLEL